MTPEISRTPPPWREKARRIARRRRWCGAAASLLLCLAALTLVDGLVALMRSGSNRIELLAGQSERLSGPVASQDPVSGDMRLRLEPETAPVDFRLEGFFPSYWFGNGMWRGVVAARPDAAPGTYAFSIGFRGGGSPQKYEIVIWPDAAARRAGALSLIQAHTGLPPLWLPHAPLPERPNRATDVWRFPVERASSPEPLGTAVFSGRKGVCLSLDLPRGGPAPAPGDVVRLGGILPGSRA